jgi:8-amino-7-oxononanoate synthase
MEAAAKAIALYGFGTGASRLLSGGTALHAELEKAIASYKGTEAALLFNSGYAANVSALPSFAIEGDIIFSDELNHASIIDGCRLSKARTVIYRHADTQHLAQLLETEQGNRKIIVTDTVFSMDGDMAPLDRIYQLCRQHNAAGQDDEGNFKVLLYIDDAHATGVLGGGKGCLAHFDLPPEPWLIQMGTFSKALGSMGAFIAADKDTVDWLINSGRGFMYSTALPACAAAASLQALQLVQKDPSLLKRLWHNRGKMFTGLQAMGLDTLQSQTPILPVAMPSSEEALSVAEQLSQRGIYAPAIRPPTVEIPRLRLTVTAGHSDEDIDTLLEALREVMD